MNLTILSTYLNQLLKLLMIALFIPFIYALAYQESSSVRGFAITIAVFFALFLITGYLKKQQIEKEKNILHSKDGFVLVAICWIFISLLGVLPYLLSGAIPRFINALFESVAGFSTVGTTILSNVEELSNSMLLWRSMTPWIGGVGVLVFVLALVPSLSAKEKTVNVMRAEFTGPTPGKLVPRLRESLGIFITIYTTLTVAQSLLLWGSGIPLFDSVCLGLTTISTGGFTITSSSLAAYGSAACYIITGVFMLLAGINFNLFYFLIIHKNKSVFQDTELRVYLGLFFGSTLFITLNLYLNKLYSLKESFVHAGFQSSAFLSSTGLATADFSLWPGFSKGILLALMLIGACAGSTGGGLKISRLLILLKECKRVLFRLIHPRAVKTIQIDKQNIDEETVAKVSAYLFLYIGVMIFSTILLSLDNFDFETTFTAAAASLSGIGVGFGSVGPMGSYQNFSVFSKLVICANMLLGRLEIYPLLLLFFRPDRKKT